MGVALEAQAEHKTAPEEQVALLKLALGNYLQVFNEGHLRDGEKADLWWTKEAGMKAARLAERLQEWSPAIKTYERLKQMLPQLSASLDNRIRKAQEHLPSQKTD